MTKTPKQSDGPPRKEIESVADARTPAQKMIDLSRRVVAVPKTEAEKKKPR